MANSLAKMAKNSQNAQKGPFLPLSSTFLLLKVRDNMVFMKNERAHAPFKFLSVSFLGRIFEIGHFSDSEMSFYQMGAGVKKRGPKKQPFLTVL